MKYAFVPITGDPFIFRYWLRFYDKEISSRIDQLYVGQVGPTNPSSLRIIRDLCNERKNIKFKSYNDGIHFRADASYQMAYNLVEDPGREEDIIALLQTDIFVFDGKILDTYFASFSNGIRLIGETKAGFITYCPDDPFKKDLQTVQQLWPGWLFCRASDFHRAYLTVIEDMKLSGFVPSVYTGAFSGYKANEEMVLFSHFLQSYITEEQRLRVDQVRAASLLNVLDTIANQFQWFHFGILDQMPLPGGVYVDGNNIPIIFPPYNKRRANRQKLSEHSSAKGLLPLYIGMYKACVLSSNDHPGLLRQQSRALKSIDRLIDTFNFNKDEVERTCRLFQGWVKS